MIGQPAALAIVEVSRPGNVAFADVWISGEIVGQFQLIVNQPPDCVGAWRHDSAIEAIERVTSFAINLLAEIKPVPEKGVGAFFVKDAFDQIVNPRPIGRLHDQGDLPSLRNRELNRNRRDWRRGILLFFSHLHGCSGRTFDLIESKAVEQRVRAHDSSVRNPTHKAQTNFQHGTTRRGTADKIAAVLLPFTVLDHLVLRGDHLRWRLCVLVGAKHKRTVDRLRPVF